MKGAIRCHAEMEPDRWGEGREADEDRDADAWAALPRDRQDSVCARGADTPSTTHAVSPVQALIAPSAELA